MKQNTRIKNRFLSIVLMTVAIFGFQNCAWNSKDSGGGSVTTSNISQLLPNQLLFLDWSYGNGTVSPAYQYNVKYKISIPAKSLEILVSKGASAPTDLPTPKTRALSESEISTLQNLLELVRFQNCSDGSAPIGGGSDSLSFYSTAQAPSHSQASTPSCKAKPPATNESPTISRHSKKVSDTF
jgi:hypothetical protein